MVQESKYIEKPAQEVYDFLMMEFAKSFKTSPSKVTEKMSVSEVDRKGSNKKIKITQQVTIPVEGKEICLLTESKDDSLVTTYIVEAIDEGTLLTIQEAAKGKNVFKNFAYKIAMLPILNSSYKQKLKQRLEAVNHLLVVKK